MAANNDSLQESILIRRAKRRLIGAFFILIILITLSFFFLQDRSQIDNPNQDIKVSFTDSDLKTKVDLDNPKPFLSFRLKSFDDIINGTEKLSNA